MTRTQRRLLAQEQRKVARDNRFRLKSWIFGPDSPYSMAERRNVYQSFLKSDVEPLMRVADLFASGRYREAYNVSWGMDTSPRDLILQKIWDAITDPATLRAELHQQEVA